MECYSRWNHKCQPRPQGLFVFQKGGGRREEGLPQPRTQASSRYPSYKRRLGTESEFSLQASLVTSHPKSPRTTGNKAGFPLQPPYWNTRRPWGLGKYNNFFYYFTSFAASGRSSQSD